MKAHELERLAVRVTAAMHEVESLLSQLAKAGLQSSVELNEAHKSLGAARDRLDLHIGRTRRHEAEEAALNMPAVESSAPVSLRRGD